MTDPITNYNTGELLTDPLEQMKHDCGINGGDCRNTCGELPITPENIRGYLEYLQSCDGSPSGILMADALEAILEMPKWKETRVLQEDVDMAIGYNACLDEVRALIKGILGK